jgi:hypothetical protein
VRRTWAQRAAPTLGRALGEADAVVALAGMWGCPDAWRLRAQGARAMMSSMADPTWPHDDPAILVDSEDLSWSCPFGICHCSGNGEHEPLEFSVMLCTHEGERPSHGRCRIWLNGVVINKQRNANHDGWMTVVAPHDVNSVFVEWAPVHTPREHPCPYRKRYFVSLGDDDESEEADRRRLHNLGFSVHDTLEENVVGRSHRGRGDHTRVN